MKIVIPHYTLNYVRTVENDEKCMFSCRRLLKVSKFNYNNDRFISNSTNYIFISNIADIIFLFLTTWLLQYFDAIKYRRIINDSQFLCCNFSCFLSISLGVVKHTAKQVFFIFLLQMSRYKLHYFNANDFLLNLVSGSIRI